MRVVVPEEKPIQRLAIPFGKLSEAIQKRQKEESLKRAPVEIAPLSESTRMATKERGTVDGRLRGVLAGESMEDARKRFAKEDGKPYVPPIEQDDLGEIDLDMYLDNPDMRDFLIEESGRSPQSVNDGPRQVIEAAPIEIEGDFEQPAKEVITDIVPKTSSTRESDLKNRFAAFTKGFGQQAAKNAESKPITTSIADNTALMRSAPMMQAESAGLNSLQEQAKRYLNRLR